MTNTSKITSVSVTRNKKIVLSSVFNTAFSFDGGIFMIFFELGKINATAQVATDLQNKMFADEVSSSLERYIKSDWGLLCKSDKDLNDEAVVNGDRILAAYATILGKIYIITEADRSSTTILYSHEY